MLYLAELGIQLPVVVDVVREQVGADRPVLNGQRAAVIALVVVLDILIQRVALHAADGYDVRIRIVCLDVVHLEKVVERGCGNVQIA